MPWSSLLHSMSMLEEWIIYALHPPQSAALRVYDIVTKASLRPLHHQKFLPTNPPNIKALIDHIPSRHFSVLDRPHSHPCTSHWTSLTRYTTTRITSIYASQHAPYPTTTTPSDPNSFCNITCVACLSEGVLGDRVEDHLTGISSRLCWTE